MSNTNKWLEELQRFQDALYAEEKSGATIRKYIHDTEIFCKFAEEKNVPLTKELVVSYKEWLLERYAVSSANTMLISLNRFFAWLGRPELRVKTVRYQRELFCADKELTRAEYQRLLKTAERQKKERLRLVIETICTTGIRVSELRYITVEALTSGTARVTCKGKHRMVFLPKGLCRELKQYCAKRKIESGPVFVTKSGAALDRSNIWTDMKKLCTEACVAPEKVFPHNLRHLFARIFLTVEKDISKLADVLGHASLDTTRIYTISSGTAHRRRINRIAKVLLFETTL